MTKKPVLAWKVNRRDQRAVSQPPSLT